MEKFEVLLNFIRENSIIINHLINVIFVDFLEIILAYIFALAVCQGKSFTEKPISQTHRKLIIVTTISLVLMHLNRSYISNFIVSSLIATFIYYICLKYVYRLNKRFSALGATLIMLLFMFAETATVQLMSNLITKIIVKNGFMNVRFIWSLPTRIIQMLAILSMYKFNFSFASNILFKGEWTSLSKAKQTTTKVLLSFLIFSIYFNANYGEIFMKMKINNIPMETFRFNLINIMISTVIFISIPIIILLRTTNYETLKDFAYRDPQDAFRIWLKVSTPEQRENYRYQLDNFDKQTEEVE